MNKETNKNKVPDEALRLLPWYATGWLSPEERDFVKENLSRYPKFKELLLTEYEIIQLVKEDKSILEKSALDSPEVRLKKVLSSISVIDAKNGVIKKPQQRKIASILSRITDSLFPDTTTKFKYASFAVLSTLTIALMFTFLSPLLKQENIFHPATLETNFSHNDKKTTILLVGLNTEPDAPKLLNVLKSSNAKISAVPGKDGMYKIDLQKKLNPKQTQVLIKQLSKHKDLFWFTGEAY